MIAGANSMNGRFQLVGMLMACGGLVSPGGSAVVVRLANYSEFPVHATAVALDAEMLCRKLGVPAGTPLQACTREGNQLVPLSPFMENGRAVARALVSIPPRSRIECKVEAADQWQHPIPVEATPVLLRNGVLRVSFGAQGWDLAFDGERSQAAGLVTGGQLDFWVDGRNRGRIMNGDPRQFGLSRFATDAREVKREATVMPDGSPRLVVQRRFAGMASALSVTETFELVPGMPVLTCRVRWQNEGESPLWIAYVGSGDGIRGRWDKRLMQGPLTERKKSALQGEIGGGETRCAWLGGLCRISMESPATGCGLGMSTLLPTPDKVGQGSMVWGCGVSGFQCNFIDPEQGQFPFLVAARGTLENGFAFLATQAGSAVFPETVAMWKALQSGKTPAPVPPCAVWVDDEVVEAQTVTRLDDCGDRSIAVRLDLHRRFECRVQGATRVTARPLPAGGKPLVLLDEKRPVDRVLDLNRALGMAGEVALAIELSAGARLGIAEVLPEAPVMLSPVPDAAITDLAAMFRWRGLPLVTEYRLQWSRSADFAAAEEARVTSSRDFPHYLVPDHQLPAPGLWHWRVRGCKGGSEGPWSEARSFTVNNDHAVKPLKRPLTADAPLFTMEATRVLDFTAFHPDIPADIARHVAIVAEGFEAKGIPVTEFARGMERLPTAIMLRSHWAGLADIEWLFQHVPNFVGIQGGEHLSSLYRDNKEGDMRYHHRLIRLCAKHGMFHQEADGTYKDDKWQELMDLQGAFTREFGPWLVLSQKNNIIRRQFYSQGAALGLWLGGITHQHGAWEDGGFYWQNAGFNGLGHCAGERSGVLKSMPRIFWALNFVMGIARGCGIYSLDGQTLMLGAKAVERDPASAWAAAIWDDTGATSDTFRRFVVPLIRGAVEHRLIPGKDAVLRNIKLAVYNDKRITGDEQTWPHYAEYGPLFAHTYGFRRMGDIDGQLWEFFPNTGRYYFIPVLPQGNEPLAPWIRNLPVSGLQDEARVRETFGQAYPGCHRGDAFLCRVGDTWIVQNTRENEDVTEEWAADLTGPAFDRFSGKIGPHAYLVGKVGEGGRRLWFQSNGEYPERETSLEIRCTRRPDWKVEPAAAAKDAGWDPASRTLGLRLSHLTGAVEVTLEAR